MVAKAIVLFSLLLWGCASDDKKWDYDCKDGDVFTCKENTDPPECYCQKLKWDSHDESER